MFLSSISFHSSWRKLYTANLSFLGDWLLHLGVKYDYSSSRSKHKLTNSTHCCPPTLLRNMDGHVQQPTSSPRLEDSHHNTSNVPRRTYPAIIHAAVACALISPIAFLPYFAARRHITALQQSVKVLTKETRRLRDELDVATSIQRSMTSELRDLREMAHNTSKLSNETHKKFNHQETERIASYEAIQTNLRELLEDSQRSRYILTVVHILLRKG
jgi:hypothetical protein